MKSLVFDAAASILFVLVLTTTHNLILATGVAAACGVVQVTWALLRRTPVPAIQWTSLALVVGLGGVSLLAHDPRFIMIKPSLVQAAIALSLLQPGWMRRYIPPHRLHLLPPRAVVLAGYAYPVALTALAGGNLAVALKASPQTWAAYTTMAPPAVFALLGLVVFATLRTLATRSRRQGRSWEHPAAA